MEKTWLPSKHIELTTRAAYHSNLDKHFLPFFGNRPMARILPSREAAISPVYHYVGVQFYWPDKLTGVQSNLVDEHPFR